MSPHYTLVHWFSLDQWYAVPIPDSEIAVFNNSKYPVFRGRIIRNSSNNCLIIEQLGICYQFLAASDFELFQLVEFSNLKFGHVLSDLDKAGIQDDIVFVNLSECPPLLKPRKFTSSRVSSLVKNPIVIRSALEYHHITMFGYDLHHEEQLNVFPVPLSHPSLANFVEYCQSTSVNPTPLETELNVVMDFLGMVNKQYVQEVTMQKAFEDVCVNTIQDDISTSLKRNHNTRDTSFVIRKGVGTKVDFSFIVQLPGIAELNIALLEFKTASGSGDADAQAGLYFYNKVVVSLKEHAVTLRYCRFPTILLSLRGRHLTVHVGCLQSSVVIYPVRDYLLAIHPEDESVFVETLKFYIALKQAIVDIAEYYVISIKDYSQTVLFTIPSFVDRRFPCYPEHLSLQYSTVIKRRVFFADHYRASGKEPVIVKICDRYGLDQHKLLAEKGLAPKLLHYEFVANKFHCVVMEYLKCHRLLELIETNPDQLLQHVSEIEEQLHAVLQLFNKGDGVGNAFVHGDLRASNMLYCPIERKLYVIDFEWSGIANESKYPVFINMDILWPQGVGPLKNITTAHDGENVAVLIKRLRKDPLAVVPVIETPSKQRTEHASMCPIP
ncbi:hypothetical protein RCL1_008194 [Eukaryota sp. TZLM3-RCL]